MARPGVNISLMNGQLGLQGPSTNGVTALVIASPAAPTAGYGFAFIVKTKASVLLAFADPLNVDVVTALNLGFFAEAPEGTVLSIVCMAQTTPLATLAAAANVEKALNAAGGKARLVGVVKFPAVGYVPVVTNGFDADVHTAVPVLQTLAETWLAAKKPFRFFVQGFACDGNDVTAKDYSTTQNRNGSVVAAEINGSSAIAMLLVMGRAAQVSPQRNIGRVKNGSLLVAQAAVLTIGTKDINTITGAALNNYWDKRYITIENNSVAAGFIITDDNSLTAVTDDYNNLRNGRVIDNGVRVAFATYYNELKDDVDVDGTGRMALVAEKALETAIETNIDNAMREQLSKKDDGTADVHCAVNPDYDSNIALYNQNGISAAPNFNLVQTGTVYLFIKMKPKGCLKYINAFIGFVATS